MVNESGTARLSCWVGIGCVFRNHHYVLGSSMSTEGPTAWMRKAIAEWQKGKTVVIVYPVDKRVLMMMANA